MQVQVDPDPAADQAQRVSRFHQQPSGVVPPSLPHWRQQVQGHYFGAGDTEPLGATVPEAKVHAMVFGLPAAFHLQLELRLLARECRSCAHGANRQPRQVGEGMQYRQDKQGDQQEGKRIAQVVLEGDRRQQHDCQAQAKEQAHPRGKNKQAFLVEGNSARRGNSAVDPALEPLPCPVAKICSGDCADHFSPQPLITSTLRNSRLTSASPSPE